MKNHFDTGLIVTDIPLSHAYFTTFVARVKFNEPHTILREISFLYMCVWITVMGVGVNAIKMTRAHVM